MSVQEMPTQEWAELANENFALVECPVEVCGGAALVTRDVDPEIGLAVMVCLRCRETFVPSIEEEPLTWDKIENWEIADHIGPGDDEAPELIPPLPDPEEPVSDTGDGDDPGEPLAGGRRSTKPEE